ncbi:MAG: HAD family hydrolase [Clostridia bacterium]|nr:HAD-IIA family hydrolase [Eubacteriales bacterium]MDD4460997.1 HAD-IIA family hydrolase [Eubacteriales bacterium]NCC48057.1 HAD family hydrolase [Clostridia bacterium]
MDQIRAKKGFICDMDGVIYHGQKILDGVKEFVEWLQRENKQFLFLTNSSERSPRELRLRLMNMGLDVEERHFYTSALATADFVASQSRRCTAYVIGQSGLLNALYEVGVTFSDVDPEYVIVGETDNYAYDSIRKAVNLVLNGAKLIGTNPDMTGPAENGIVPACKALIAPIELATGRTAYFVGKPNPLMMRTGLKLLGCEREDAVIIGDRMDTDIIAGIESEIDTILVMSGVSSRETIGQFPYRPVYVLNHVGEVITRPDGDSGLEI